MVSQLHCAVLSMICQVDTIELLSRTVRNKEFIGFACLINMRINKQIDVLVNLNPVCSDNSGSNTKSVFFYLIVLDGLSQRFHLHSLIELIFMQQVNEIIQRALMEAHLRVQGTHALKSVHATGIQSPETKAEEGEKDRPAVLLI